jgi:Leucine-rich repeat (LRR) protein
MAVWREANGSQSQRGIFAQRLDSSGNQLWGSNGVTVVALNSSYDYLDLSVAGFGEELISAYIQQSANMNGDIYANRLDAEGNSAWTDETVTVTNSDMAKSDMMAGKGPNCLFIAWSENGSVYAHCLREDGTLGAPDVDSPDCIADDGTDGIELWGECYSIENTDTLDLSGNGLTGSISPEIGNLTNLIYLRLSINQFTGNIPSEIGNLTNLTYLSLLGNQLTGEIPSEIGNLTNLIGLYLSGNQLTGSIPSEIGNLTNLIYLSLRYNQLTGSIPPEIGNLTNLTYLNLRSNQLTGSIPSEIGNLTNLTQLYLYDNQLTGEIPPEIGNLTNLTWLSLSENQLTGEIPSEIGNLTNLIGLNLSYNELTGSIPPEIGNLTNLERLDLYNTQLTGSIPPEIGNLTNLIRLFLYDNNLTGEIPESICDLNINWSNNSIFNISNNQLCPPYPTCVEDYVGEQDTTNCEQVSIIDGTLPITYNLYNAYPNPFNPVTSLRYDLPKDGLVNITVYDMMGRAVKTLVNSSQTAGYKSIQWNATNNQGQQVSAGLYLYTIEAGDFRQTKKMVLLK